MILFSTYNRELSFVPSPDKPWISHISELRANPFRCNQPQNTIHHINSVLSEIDDLPLYTLCDGAGGAAVGFISPHKLTKIHEERNFSDISPLLYISHPFRQHYTERGKSILKVLAKSGYAHSDDPDDYMLFHYLVGGRHSYTHAHNHDTATALLLDGSKEWWLCPSTPHNATHINDLFKTRIRMTITNPYASFADWLSENYEKASSIEDLFIIMQPPGTSLYIPYQWFHAVINHQLSRSITLAWPYPNQTSPAHYEVNSSSN